jgi:hypothetical protein
MKFAVVPLLTLFLLLASGRSLASAQEITLPPEVVKRQASVPETVLYRVLLHQAATFKDKADELDRQGKDGSPYRQHISNLLGLNAQQMIALNQVALQYRQESAQVELAIADSVRRFRELNKSLHEGQQATLPPEAKYLINRREEGIRHARDQFHSTLGDKEFLRIDGQVKSRYSAGFQHGGSAGFSDTNARGGGDK